MNDIPSPLMIMLAGERLRDYQRERDRIGQPPQRIIQRTLHFQPIRRTIGLTLIRTGRVLAGAQLNGA